MSVSRLLATTNVGHEKVIVSLIIDDVMPVECVRRVHRVATFSHTQPVQDTANQARAALSEFRGVTMPKGQIFITQIRTPGRLICRKPYYQWHPAALSCLR